MNLRITIILVSLLLQFESFSQYFYKDIMVNDEINTLNERIHKAKVVNVKVKSYEFDNTEVEDFLCEQEVESNGKHIITVTGSPFIGENHLHSFFSGQHKILRSVDSNPTIIIQNFYEYNQNKLSKITINSFEVENKAGRTTEVHQWFYDQKNVPVKMLLIKNNTDTTLVSFVKDTVKNLVTDEIITYKGIEKERYYYYYDDKNRLTDVVRYHPYKRKLLPEYIFSYNDQNELIQKTIFTTGTNQYTNWRYFYNDKGLKTEEQAFLKGNLQRGSLKYFYKYE